MMRMIRAGLSEPPVGVGPLVDVGVLGAATGIALPPFNGSWVCAPLAFRYTRPFVVWKPLTSGVSLPLVRFTVTSSLPTPSFEATTVFFAKGPVTFHRDEADTLGRSAVGPLSTT